MLPPLNKKSVKYMIREILKLGDPRLYERSAKVTEKDFEFLPLWAEDLHDTLLEYRRIYGAGRAIAAPQIGIKKRIIYMLTDKEYIFINPALTFPSKEKYEVMDDCMSFPGLCVKVRRYRYAEISYLDGNMQPQTMRLSGDYSELLQHEYDHLDGILATMRAIDEKSFHMMQMKRDL